MKFSAPSGYEFEIPDPWLTEADIPGDFAIDRQSYEPDAVRRQTVLIVALSDIWTTLESRPVFDPPGPFVRARMVDMLRKIQANVALDPVDVSSRKGSDARYTLLNGYHRYHASIALKLTAIPVLVCTAWDKPYVPRSFPCGCCNGTGRGDDAACDCCQGSGRIEAP